MLLLTTAVFAKAAPLNTKPADIKVVRTKLEFFIICSFKLRFEKQTLLFMNTILKESDELELRCPMNQTGTKN